MNFPPKTFLLDGQQVTFVEGTTNILKFAIHEPFFKAGQPEFLNWNIAEFGSVGLGINHSIIKFTERAKCKLIIHIDSEGYDCIIGYDVLKQFIKNHNNEYRAGGKKFVHVIPLKLCVGHHNRQEMTA